MKGKFILILVSLFLLVSFTLQDDDFLDISSFANINEIKQNTIDLDLNIDFDNKK
jgi:hypothetical protein